MERRVVQLDHDLRSMIQNHIWGHEFNQKEAEIRKLKAELARIDAEKQQPLLTKSPPLPFQPSTFNTYQPFYTPSLQKTTEYAKHVGLTHTLYQTPIQTRPKKPQTKSHKPSTSSQAPSPAPITESPQSPGLPTDKDSIQPDPKQKASLNQYSFQASFPMQVLSESSNYDQSIHSSADSQATETETESQSESEPQTSSGSKSEFADISRLLIVEPSTSVPPFDDPTKVPSFIDEPEDGDSNVEDQPSRSSHHSSKLTSKNWFTFDDLPKNRWPARFQEFATWIDVQILQP